MTAFFAFLKKHRFSLLLGSLLLTIGGSAILSELRLPGVQYFLILLNMLVLLAVVPDRWALGVGLGLVAVFLIFWILSTLAVVESFLPVSSISAVVMLIMGTLSCFRMAFSPGLVDRERLAAALSLYLLFGLIFALIFAVIDELLPGSFHFAAARPVDFVQKPLSDVVYFSFVTLATLGYGDIVPLSSSARGLAILEAIVGQMYLVVIVARLVSLYGQSEHK